jgi:Fe-S-cluster-containing hydrogenase component 2
LNDASRGIFDLLVGAEKRKRQKTRKELLKTVGIDEEFFESGDITIDKFTCRGAECKLCIDACPTNALYWDEGIVKIEQDLCIYCNACVLSCIVDNCIIVTRKRSTGQTERFGTPREAMLSMNTRSAQQRVETVKSILQALASTNPEEVNC